MVQLPTCALNMDGRDRRCHRRFAGHTGKRPLSLNLVVRIDKKLANGIDDSDDTSGKCLISINNQLPEYASTSPELESVIHQFCDAKTNFGFEEHLRRKL